MPRWLNATRTPGPSTSPLHLEIFLGTMRTGMWQAFRHGALTQKLCPGSFPSSCLPLALASPSKRRGVRRGRERTSLPMGSSPSPRLTSSIWERRNRQELSPHWDLPLTPFFHMRRPNSQDCGSVQCSWIWPIHDLPPPPWREDEVGDSSKLPPFTGCLPFAVKLNAISSGFLDSTHGCLVCFGKYRTQIP